MFCIIFLLEKFCLEKAVQTWSFYRSAVEGVFAQAVEACPNNREGSPSLVGDFESPVRVLSSPLLPLCFLTGFIPPKTSNTGLTPKPDSFSTENLFQFYVHLSIKTLPGPYDRIF